MSCNLAKRSETELFNIYDFFSFHVEEIRIRFQKRGLTKYIVLQIFEEPLQLSLDLEIAQNRRLLSPRAAHYTKYKSFAQ